MLEHKNREQLWGEGKGSVDDEMVEEKYGINHVLFCFLFVLNFDVDFYY